MNITYKHKPILNLILALSVYSFQGNCQLQRPSIPTPNAISLGTYGEVPVSHFTGIPNISVPIYELTGKNVKVPISLSYHAQGVRPNILSGWTGIGWTLMAGGAITRKQRGLRDEEQARLFNWSAKPGFYFNTDKIANGNWASGLNAVEKYPMVSDTEPDEFIFHFLGISGRFFLGEDRHWHVESDKDLKIVFNTNDFLTPDMVRSTTSPIFQFCDLCVTPTFRQFTIIDEDGNHYVFGGTDSAIEYSYNPSAETKGREGETYTATTWCLTKIIVANTKNEIDFEYQRGPFIAQLNNELHYTYTNGADSNSFLNPGCSSWSFQNGYSAFLTSPVYLKVIVNREYQEKINFFTSKSNDLKYNPQYYELVLSQNRSIFDILENYLPIYTSEEQIFSGSQLYNKFLRRKLDKIEIINSSTNEIIRKISFNYRENPDSRLRLSSLQFMNSRNAVEKQYRFEYNDQISLPAYLTTCDDHWGFNNNVSWGQWNMNTFESGKGVNSYYTQAEILKEIFYPTGGSTEFQFETNRYGQIVSKNRNTLLNEKGESGGLRIRKIISKGGGLTNETEYKYFKNWSPNSSESQLQSSGILDSKPTYNHNTNFVDTEGVSSSHGIFSSDPIIPLTISSTGNHNTYSEVAEIRGNGYSIFKFTNHDNGYMDQTADASFNQSLFPYIPNSSSKNFTRGKLLFRKDYDKNGRLVKRLKNDYYSPNSLQKSRAVFNKYFVTCPGQSASRQAVSRSCYYNYYSPFLLEKSEVTEYTITGYYEQAETFSYNSKRLVQSKTIKNSSGEDITTTYQYPMDFISDPFLFGMTRAHIYTPVIEEKITNSSKNTFTLTRTNYTTVTGKVDDIITGLPRPGGRQQSSSPDIFVVRDIQTQTDQSPLETRWAFNKYDPEGNLLEMQKTNDVKEVYLWGYNGQYPVAKIIGTDYATVSRIISQSTLDNSVITDEALRNELNKLRTDTRTSSAQITTYTYRPLIGMTSETDSNGFTTYYEYDEFNRLSVVKDNDRNVIKKYTYNYKK